MIELTKEPFGWYASRDGRVRVREYTGQYEPNEGRGYVKGWRLEIDGRYAGYFDTLSHALDHAADEIDAK